MLEVDEALTAGVKVTGQTVTMSALRCSSVAQLASDNRTSVPSLTAAAHIKQVIIFGHRYVLHVHEVFCLNS